MMKIPQTFLTSASDILGDTDNGLTGSEIVSVFNAYAFDYHIDCMPHAKYPFDAPNKRTALLDNVSVFV